MSEEFVQSMQTTEVAEASAVKKSTKKSGKIGNKRGAAGTAIIYTILGIYTLFLMAPFLVIIVTSFTPDSEYLEASSYIWFPSHFSLEGYQAVFLEDPYAVDGIPSLLRGFINSMWITLIPLVSGLFMSCLVSYCYSKNRFPAKNTLFMITVTTMFIPLGAFSFVSYMFYQQIGWTEGGTSVLPLIIPGLFGSAGTIFFLRPYIDSISTEMIEAAQMDGMNFWQIFFKIIIPLSKPAIIAQFIFGFAGGYNNYSGALLYLGTGDESLWTLQLSLNNLISYLSKGDGGYNVKCALTLMALLPLIIVYVMCQKYFIGGIAFGGGKE